MVQSSFVSGETNVRLSDSLMVMEFFINRGQVTNHDSQPILHPPTAFAVYLPPITERTIMLTSLRARLRAYPFQFWLLFGGLFVSTLGTSLVWPFLTIYVKGKLGIPMTQVAGLMTIYAITALVFSFVGGPIIDRAGRKWTMVFSLAWTGVAFLWMNRADSLLVFAIIMALRGAITPLYPVAADAMQADLIAPEKRIDAYALTRMSQNAAIALGPAIGGFLAARSYAISFQAAFVGLLLAAILYAVLARETRPEVLESTSVRDPFAGYGRIFGDKPFMNIVLGFTFAQMCATMVWVLMGVYVTENFSLTEREFGFIPMTNALMVVALQVAVTARTKHRQPQIVLAAGTFLYALAVASIAFGASFWAFWASMVILTLGELLLVPTSTTIAANLAPPDMRGRYMGMYSITWQVAAGIGPLIGGVLNDNISPRATWLGGGLIGLLGTLFFLYLARRQPLPQPAITG